MSKASLLNAHTGKVNDYNQISPGLKPKLELSETKVTNQQNFEMKGVDFNTE